ncbi:MAG: hypothetical protein AAFQ82_03520 [Myxococcota bacterium]
MSTLASGLTPLLCVGCMTVYQPLQGLQDPTLLDLGASNFEQTSLELRCPESDAVDREQARKLCTVMRQLFENQGAQVRDGEEIDVSDGEHPSSELVVELRSRMIDDRINLSSYLLSVITFSLVPAVSERSVAQTVTVLDSKGRQLARRTYEWRMNRYIGVGVWSVNWVLDSTARAEEDELTGDVASERFSQDLYRQVSQLTFNAKQRLSLTEGG